MFNRIARVELFLLSCDYVAAGSTRFEQPAAHASGSRVPRTIQLEEDGGDQVCPTTELLSGLHYNTVIIGSKIA